MGGRAHIKKAAPFAALVAVLVIGWVVAKRSAPGTAEPRPDSSTTKPRKAGEPYRIGVLYWSATIQGQVAMRKGLEDESTRVATPVNGPAVELVTRVAGDGDEGQERQIRQMRELLEMKLDAIIVQPTDNAALSDGLRQANRQKVPVVAYDQFSEGGTLAAFVTSDNRQAGELDGEYIASRFSNERVLKIALVEYPQVSSTVARVDGFFAALRAQGQRYELAGVYQAVEPVAGRKVGKQILADFPERGSLDVVFTVNDGGGLNVVDELAKADRDEIQVATVDGDPASVKNIEAGRLTVIDSAQFCAELGRVAMRTTYSILQGQKVPRRQLVPVFPITKETRSRYNGWEGAIAEPFDKPWPSKTPRWTPNTRSTTSP